MSTTKTAPTNGATKEPNAAANSNNTNEQKPELSNVLVPAPVQRISIEERLKRFNQLTKLVERREQVLEALNDLGGFQISPTGGALLQLKDSKGKTFAIAHPIVIGEMVSLAKDKLQVELSNIEAQFII